MNPQAIDNTLIHDVLLCALTGDALGTPFEGLGKAHLHAVFGPIDSYSDPEPALKGRMDRWRKPGMYSSISQLMLLLSGAFVARKRDPISCFSGLVRAAPAVEASVFGPFRHPGVTERGLLERLMGASDGAPRAADAFPCARPLAALAPAALFLDGRDRLRALARAAALCSRERFTVAGAVIGASVLRIMAVRPPGGETLDILREAAAESGNIIADLDECSADLFAMGLNPDSLIDAAGLFEKALSGAAAARDIASAEAAIVLTLNTVLKTPATRATVNHPLCVLPYALAHARFFAEEPAAGLFHASMEGGSSAALASLTAQYITAARGMEWMPDSLVEGLVNRTRAKALCESIAGRRTTETELSEFIDAEAGLTRKELQELGGRTKHGAPKTKKPPTRKQAEDRIARITVESWTKADRAKWKKEKKNYDKHGE